MKKLLGVMALALWAATAVYTVDQTEFAYVTRFGRHLVTIDGGTDAGLRVKLPWPVDAVTRVDRRVSLFDLPPAELLTHDPQGRTIDRTLTIEVYVAWRVAGDDGVDRFVRTVGTPEQARLLLGQRIGGRVGAVVGTLPLEEFVSVAAPAEVAARSDRLREKLLTGTDGDLRALARDGYGIEIVDVRLRRFNYPPAVRPAIAERIVSERARKAAEYQGEGARRAAEITSTAARDAAIREADARAEAQRVQERAAAEADALRARAHALDPEFYTFLQKLKTYQRILSDTRDVLLLSSRHELFDLLLRPPKANGTAPPSRSASPNGGPSP